MDARHPQGSGHFPWLWASAGSAWIAGAFVPATSSGIGSTLSAHQLADLVQSGSVTHWVPSWVGLAWYLVPIGGAVLVMCSALDGVIAHVTRLVTASAAAVVSLALALYVTRWSPSRFGPSTWLSVLATAAAGAALMIPVASPMTRVKRRSD